jgi:two-component system alkaline phosphatase synthesis response regulator PhoP
MKTKAKILIVDDEEDIVEFLKYNLEQDGYIVEGVYDGPSAIKEVANFKPHLIILDIMMPEMDGIEVCEILRSNPENSKTIIVFLTARSESLTQITALETGGDDFINKPIKPSVFRSRIKAILRRHNDFNNDGNRGNIVVFGDIEINYEQFKVKVKEEEVPLAKKEFELLTLLASKPGKVFKRDEIMNKVWGDDVIVGDRTIDVHIRKLREKLGDTHISTMKGVGYKLDF